LQFGIISKIVRVGYLLQNFKKSIIQNRDPKDEVPVGGHPCQAEVRWYGATDAGLRDVRDNIHLWGLECEIERHAELSAIDKHKYNTPIEISDIVLSEQWDLKKRKELYRIIHEVEYDGDL